MRPECVNAIEEALGRPLRTGEEQKYENEIATQKYLLARREPDKWRALSPWQRNEAAATAATERLMADAAKTRANAELQIAAYDRINNLLADQFEKLGDNEKPQDRSNIVRQLVAQDVRAKGVTSAESWGKAIRAEAVGKMESMFEASGKVLGLFRDPQGITAIEKELHGEDSGNPDAAKAAKDWFALNQELRSRANAAGQDIGRLPDKVWARPQNHSAALIGREGLEDWSNFLIDRLDRKMYVNNDGSMLSKETLLGEVLPKTFDSIITDGMSDKDLGQNYASSVENRNAQHRYVFFKDAQSSMEYQAKFGRTDMLSSMVNHVSKLSKEIGLMEMLGPNPESTFNYFNEKAALDSKRFFPGQNDVVDKSTKFNSALYDRVAGHTEVINQNVANWSQAYRNFKTLVGLPGVAITAMGDEAGMWATAAANKTNYAAVLGQELKYLNPANGEDRALARSEGVGLGGMLGELQRFSGDNLTGGETTVAGKAVKTTGKLTTLMLKLNGAEPLWDARRQGLGAILKSKLGELTRTVDNFSDINEADHGLLSHKGVTENDWQVWKKADVEDWGVGAPTVLTPKTIWSIPDSELASMGDPTALKRHASTMLMSHILEETGKGVMDVSALNQAKMRLGAVKGTYSGELWNASMLFRGFAGAMMMNHWGTMASMEQGKFGYAARLGITGTLIAAAGMQLRAILFGKNLENMADPRFWLGAVLRGGGLGYYGDFLYSELNESGTSQVAGLMGPIASDTEQVLKLAVGNPLKMAAGEHVDEAAEGLRFLRNNTPFLGMPYTRAAADHLIWNNIQEAVNPGYLDRMMGRAYQNKGTTYYWDPHEATPSAPDLSTGVDTEKASDFLNRWKNKVF